MTLNRRTFSRISLTAVAALLGTTAALWGAQAEETVASADESAERAATGLDEHDRVFSYQLSNIEGKKAIKILTSLGYETKDLSGASGSAPADELEAVAFNTKASGPVIFNLVDSEDLSIATSSHKIPDIATGAAQQRLLIVWNERKPKELQQLLDLLHEQIDVPAKQILVEVLVIELDSGKLEQLGVAFEGSKDGNSASFLKSATTGGPLPFIYQFTRPSVKTILNLTATLEALVEDGTARVLSQPSVLLLDGRTARVAVNDQIPYARVLSSNLDASNTVIADTAYVTAGIELNLRARANADDTEVTMRVIVDISSTSTASTTVGLVGPQVAERNVKTAVRVTNHTPFVIGGLIRETQDWSKGGLPVLSKIPGLGRLFSRTSKNKATSEVIVVLTPHIIPPNDRSFSYTIPRDFDLFDYSGLELFRNVYRIKTSDVWDLDFIRESEFIESLASKVVAIAERIYEGLDPKQWPPLAKGDRAGLARQLRQMEQEDWRALARALDAGAHVDSSTVPQELRDVPYKAFLTVLEGRIPGEDKLVKRMLIEIIEGRETDWKSRRATWKPTELEDLSQRVLDDKIIFFPRPEGPSCKEEMSPQEEAACIADTRTVILKPVPLFGTIGKPRGEPQCTTDILSYELSATSQLLPFDPPTAKLDEEDIENGRFNQELRKRNKLDAAGHRWKTSAILLNDCYQVRGRSLRDHLKSVLVLKRLLDLNPTLPLTLDGFHVGRDIVLPSTDDLENRYYLVDWEAATLFYETLDYYSAFEQTVESVLRTPAMQRLIEAAEQPAASPAPPASMPGGGEADAPSGHRIDEIVQAWAAAWSARNADAYLSFYAAGFRPANGRSLDEWSALRRQRIADKRSIEVELSDLQVSDLGPAKKRATFVQDYRSDTYRDVVHKTLVLIRQADRWKILSETTEEPKVSALSLQ